MKRTFKRVMAIHDLSGLGRSSLMAATPVLSVMGIQVCPVPTAVLSSQTSGFSDYTFVDLTDTLPAYLGHWKQLQMDFDGIYSGFLGSAEQIGMMRQVLQDFSTEETLVVIDPVLGDDNALYDTMDASMVEQMRQLIGNADIITPNETEVKLLLGMDLQTELMAEDMEPLFCRLAELGPKNIVVTGMRKTGGGRCVCCYETAHADMNLVDYRQLPVSYPGTGDIFASVLTGAMLNGSSLQQAVELAADFISHTVADAIAAGEPVRDGVQLESNLYRLVKAIASNEKI